jgi:hypothetical protein
MWFYVQMWLPIVTVALTAAICFSVASFITSSALPVWPCPKLKSPERCK